MSKKSRYFLLFLGFLLFLFLAPIIVLYVRGVNYDFTQQSFVQTGILAVRAEPASVNIYVNGKLSRTGAGDIKFLKPGEYSLSLKKPGFNDWAKVLPIAQNTVTWASLGAKIYLLKSNPVPANISGGIIDFYRNQNLLAYITADSLVFSSLGSPTSQTYTLPLKNLSSITASPNNKFFLLQNASKSISLVFNADTKIFTNISGLFSSVPQIKFSGSNNLFALENGNLYLIDLLQKQKTIVQKNIKAFSFLDAALYFMTATSGPGSLMISNPPYSEGNEITKNIPLFKNGEIIINQTKQILLLLDGVLFKVGDVLIKLADNLTQWQQDPSSNTLAYFQNGELDSYNDLSNNSSFITRSALPIINPVLNLTTNYAFYIKNNSIIATELDTRDRQNEYVLYAGTDIKKFAVDGDGKIIVILDNGELKSLEIR